MSPSCRIAAEKWLRILPRKRPEKADDNNNNNNNNNNNRASPSGDHWGRAK